MTQTINSDAILVRLGYSSKAGESASFLLGNDAWEQLKGLEGRNFALVLALVAEDGQPEPIPRPNKSANAAPVGPKAWSLVQRCREKQFQEFCRADTEEEARAYCLNNLGIDSRKEADNDERAHAFARLTGKYQAWVSQKSFQARHGDAK